MKNKEPKSMEEIHKIREKMFYETKDMTIREFMKYINNEARSFKSKHNLKFQTPKRKPEFVNT